jgi:hypothetical protein
LNFYLYCGNDPIDFIDIEGLSSIWTIGNGNRSLSFSENGLKQFIAIVVGESGNTQATLQSAAIASVLLNQIKAKGINFIGDNFACELGGSTYWNAIGGAIYKAIMNSSMENILDPSNEYSDRISGAFSPMLTGTDYSEGAYFTNTATPQTGFNWDNVNNHTYIVTTTIGETAFFRYANLRRQYPFP